MISMCPGGLAPRPGPEGRAPFFSAAVKRIPARERAEAVWLWAREPGAGADVPPQRRLWLADLHPPVV